MTTIVQSHDEVIPGYVLAERIGSGGYAEVWRARAQGGIDKAVKIVNGYYDEEFACQEMKALERIKDVRHPFLLSLERFEVVNGRLAILTELADMSLEQRAQECRAEGLAGIPRQELLRYLSDTAEALDYLAQRYGLQHLDIKPANLLILGGHVKVADFGLVKELSTRTQNSLVAGMTPTYASPEMFDDAPSANSDQYSLAIVYQELLVGVRAFPGRTAAQLAKQHTQSQPQLSALPAHDQLVVARALAKNPVERYPSCRGFIEALVEAAELAARQDFASAKQPQAGAPSTALGTAQVLNDTKSGSLGATRPNVPVHEVIATRRVERSSPPTAVAASERTAGEEEICISEEITDVAMPDFVSESVATRPTLFIAAGGVGVRTLCRLRDMLASRRKTDGAVERAAFMAVDTDRIELKEACSRRLESPLTLDDALHLPLRLPQDYGDDSRDLLAWTSRRWLYNIPRSLETQGYRPLGRIALVDHTQKVVALIDRKLKQLLAEEGCEQNGGRSLRVVVVAGTGGGTGAGMATDLANAARSRPVRAMGAEAEVHGFLIGAFLGGSNSSLAAASTFALLTELHHACRFGNQGVLSQRTGEHPFEFSGPPFDHVYYMPPGARSRGAGPDESLAAVAHYLSLEALPEARAALRACRAAATPRESSIGPAVSIRSFGCALVSEAGQGRQDHSTECVTESEGATDQAVASAISTPDKCDDLRQVLERASVDVANCGHDRRTMLVVPQANADEPNFAVLRSERPAAAIIRADVEEPVLIVEASGISPRSIARELERVHPGIADAAGRLLTRVDIEWQGLR